MSGGVGRRHSSDLVWLWLWQRLAATALIGPLAWELPYAIGTALKRPKEKNGKNNDNDEVVFNIFEHLLN